MKTFILVFGCNEPDINSQILNDLKLDSISKELNIEIIRTHISNVFFLINKSENLTEGKLSEYFRNLIFEDSALILTMRNRFDLIIKQVTDDSKAF